MRKPRGKKAKRQAVEKQRLRNGARNVQKVPLSPLSSPLLSVCLDLCMCRDAADEAPSGEHPMGDRPADAASPPPGELCRIAIVTRDPLSFLLVFFLTLTRALALLILSELSRVRANRRVRAALIPCPRSPLPS